MVGRPWNRRPCPVLRQLAGEHPDPDRRAGRRRRPRRFGGGGVGGARRDGRGARGRRGVPTRQDLRRRADPACHRRAAAAGPRGLAARPHGQPGPARPRLRSDPAAAVAGRNAAVLGQRRGSDRARRPPAHHRDQGRRGGDRRRPGGRRTPRGGPGGGRRVPLGLGDLRDRVPAAGRGRRRALPAGQGARPGLAPGHCLRRRRALVHHLGDVRRPLDQLAPGAARRGRRDPVRVRLDLPAGQRRGEHRRRQPGHLEASRRGGDQAADAALRRRAPRGLPAFR